MKSDYMIEINTLGSLRDLYRRESVDHPNCIMAFAWGGDSTGWTGVMMGMHRDRNIVSHPHVYYYEEIPICFLFIDDMPEELKRGVLCLRGVKFEILPIKDFSSSDLVEGILERTIN